MTPPLSTWHKITLVMQVGAADCILGKIGYGAVSESLAHGKPFVFVRRDYFNEEPFLRKQLEIHGLALEIKRRDFLQGNWQAFLRNAVTLKSSYRLPSTFQLLLCGLLRCFNLCWVWMTWSR